MAALARSDRFVGIDVLRGMAAVCVLLFHVWLYARPTPPAGPAQGLLDGVWSSGRLGLVLFFVLSGYLLYRPWADACAGRCTPPRLGRYVRARAHRILPAYYVALAGSVLLLWGAAGTPGVRLPPAEQLPLFAVFAQNLRGDTIMKLNPPMWTLAVEVGFYVLLPLAGALAVRARRWAPLVPVALLLAGVAYTAAIGGRGLAQPWTKALPAFLPLFAVGMLSAHLPQRWGSSAAARRGLLAAAVALVVSDAAWHQLGAGSLGPVLRDLPAGAGFAAALLAVRHLQSRNLAVRAFAALGTVSFGLYLWNVPVLWWLRSRGLLPLQPLAALPVVLAPTLVIAALSWHLVERPAIRRAAAAQRAPEPAGDHVVGAPAAVRSPAVARA